METMNLIQSRDIKVEPDCEEQTVNMEARDAEENEIFPVRMRTRMCSPSLSCIDCEERQHRNEGRSPNNGSGVHIGNAERGHGCTQEPCPQDQKADNKERQEAQREIVHQSGFRATCSDDVKLVRGSSTESGPMFSVCDMNAKLCVTGASCELQNGFRMRTLKVKKTFICDVCEAEFASCSHLKQHMRTHTGEKPYKCDLCGAGFALSGNLIRHVRTHTGEKPYKCDVCGAGFASCSQLKTHKRIHSGEKPYTCDVCWVGFTFSGNLKRHIRTHTGEKPYKCDICWAGFAVSGNLKSHKKIHT